MSASDSPKPPVMPADLVYEYQSASRDADVRGDMFVNPQAMAGLLMAQHGTIALAIKNIPYNTGFFGRVLDELRAAARNQESARAPWPSVDAALVKTSVRTVYANDVHVTTNNKTRGG